MYYRPLLSEHFIATLRGLNLWTLKQKIKDRTVEKTPTFQLHQRIDIIKWNEPERQVINQLMLATYSYKPKTNPNLRFSSNLNQARQRFIEMHGKIHRTTGDMASHSFVLQFMQCLEVFFAHTAETGIGPLASDPVMIRDDTNTVRTVQNSSFHDYSGNSDGRGTFAFEGGVTVTAYGILAGTGTTAPTGFDYTIQTPIAHGISAGQLYHGATSVSGATVAGSNVDMTILRLLGNSSGGTIIIREIGLKTRLWVSSSTQYHFLVAHDAVNQTVNNGETAVIMYTLRTTT
jgi:hypothetical protein